jgi:hypothetical protein
LPAGKQSAFAIPTPYIDRPGKLAEITGLLALASGASAEAPIDTPAPNSELARPAFFGEDAYIASTRETISSEIRTRHLPNAVSPTESCKPRNTGVRRVRGKQVDGLVRGAPTIPAGLAGMMFAIEMGRAI